MGNESSARIEALSSSHWLSLGYFFALILPTLFFISFAKAAPSTVHVNGRILKTDGTPLSYNNVSFALDVLSPDGACVLYKEVISGIDMSNSNGYFAIALGSGTRSFPVAATDVADKFDNSGTFTCDGGATFSPAANAERKIRIQFHDGSGYQLFTPDSVVRAVPYAWSANSAQKLAGFTADDFLKLTGLPICASGYYLTYRSGSLSCETPAAAGTLAVSGGGTGATTLTANRVLMGNGTSAISVLAAGTAGQVLTSNGASAPTWQAPAGLTSSTSANYVPYFTSATNLASTNIFYSGTRVGIGTSVPATVFHVNGDSTFGGSVTMNGTSSFNNNVTINNPTSINSTLTVGGNITAAAFLYSSDRRLKKDVRTFEKPLETIQQLHGVRFNWKKDGSPDVGFIAQEVEAVVPELVNTYKGAAGDKTKAVKYGNIVAITVEAIKDLWAKVLGLDERVQALEAKNLELEKENAKLKSDLDQNLKLINERLGRLEEK